MIDKNGKLFGKISIVDIIIVVALLAAFLFVLDRFGILSPKQVVSANTEKIRITFYQEEVNTFTAENVKPGDPVSETLKNTSLGSVVDIKTDKSISWGVDKNGKHVKSTKAGFSSIYLTTEVNGQEGPGGIVVDGYRFYVGQAMIIRAGTSTFYCRVYDVKKVEED